VLWINIQIVPSRRRLHPIDIEIETIEEQYSTDLPIPIPISMHRLTERHPPYP
jgi:hypothetical protein